MSRVVTLDDITLDECGYQIVFNDKTVGVDEYDDIEAYALDLIERHGDEVLRAILVLKWVRTNHLGTTCEITDSGSVTANG